MQWRYRIIERLQRAIEYNKAMKYAAHIEIVKLLQSWEANAFDTAVRKAQLEITFSM